MHILFPASKLLSQSGHSPIPLVPSAQSAPVYLSPVSRFAGGGFALCWVTLSGCGSACAWAVLSGLVWVGSFDSLSVCLAVALVLYL